MEQASVRQCAGVGVEVQGGVKAKLERVDISECAGWGVRAARGSTLQLAASRILRCGGGGLRAEAPAGGAVVVTECEIASNGGVGVALENCVRKAALKTVGLAAGIAGAMRRERGPLLRGGAGLLLRDRRLFVDIIGPPARRRVSYS